MNRLLNVNFAKAILKNTNNVLKTPYQLQTCNFQ